MSIILKGQLAYMNQFFEVIGITGKDEKHFNTVAEREGILMVPVNMKRPISLFSDLRALFQLIKVFRKIRPDIVHTHTPKAGLLGMLAGWLTRVPIRIHTVAGMPLMGVRGMKRWILKLTERITYRSANKIWPNSSGLLSYIEENKLCPPHKMKMIAHGASNGINPQYFSVKVLDSNISRNSFRIKYGIGNEDVVYTFVGRIAREKGVEELVNAFTSLFEEHNKVKLLFVGLFEKEYGGLSSEVEHRMEDHPAIILTGRTDDVRPFLLASDIFVFPSYREGMPNALMEAGAMGLPSIATNINGCNEIVEHGVNGLLVPAEDESRLSAAMTQLYEDVPLRNSLARHARLQVVSRFSNNIIWSAMKQEYQKILQIEDES